MVKHHDFKRCDQSGFCKRNRALADDMTTKGSPASSPYQLESSSIKLRNGQLDGHILKSISATEKVKLPLTISFLDRGKARITIDEETRQKKDIELRHGSVARKERYNEAANWALTGAGLQTQKSAKVTRSSKDQTEVTWGGDGQFKLVIRNAPFGIEAWSGEQKQVALNDRGFMNVEHWRPKIDKPKPEDGETEAKPQESEEDESTWWDETFGGNTDSKPKGPESMALDITFPGFEHVYGLAEHTGPLSLKETRGGDGNFDQPYRMYNSDVFEYELDSPMTLYGSIPFMQAHKKGSSVGVFWLNAAETWVDIVKNKHSGNPLSLGLVGGSVDTQTHWMSESGQMDLFIMMRATPDALSKSYGELTGYTQLPAAFAVGYHQCRWNYVGDEDVKDVDRKFDKYNIPYDVIWLDIEYTDEKKYFTWDPLNFPDPIGMEKQLDETERKLVVIIDPHIKNTGSYPVVDELKSKDLAVHNKENNIFEGWCWPGSSHWIDAFNPAARTWWKSLFTYDKFKGTMSNVWLWNDMNEPSVFNGPELTMPRDNLHYGNWEHRDLHNLNGLTFHNATYHALIERKKGEIRRPFVLTRSFYAGSQRTAAMWTGDNQADWGHLKTSIPMVLNQGVSGYPFGGADVGGFFGNPSKELLTRWYQAGAFYPFMRGHAHIDTRRREPYMDGEPYTEIKTQALRLRYSLLPAWYTAFYEASTDGYPIVRAQYYVHPEDDKGFAIDDQLYLGSTGLLTKPVTTEGAESVDIYLSDDENYFDYYDYTIHSGGGKSHMLPILMQGGHIVPRKDRPRKSSGLMKWDPYTLVVVLDKKGEADGTLYVDDGETFDYQQGAYIHRQFKMTGSMLSSEDLATKSSKTSAYLKIMKDVKVEKIIVVNAPSSWDGKTTVSVTEGSAKSSSAELIYHPVDGKRAAWATIRNPGVAIGVDWKIELPGAGGSVKTEL
jgi:mannosyl-oligosaccharide alpha-1,3-glucosidase